MYEHTATAEVPASGGCPGKDEVGSVLRRMNFEVGWTGRSLMCRNVHPPVSRSRPEGIEREV